MTSSTAPSPQRLERRSLWVSIASNAVVGLAGIVTALLSNSQALMVDGLFSFVGVAAAIVALRVSARVGQKPDKIRPLGYAMDEAIFTMFRSMFLLGMVAFAGTKAAVAIVNYGRGIVPLLIDYGPIGIYMVGVTIISLGTWFLHRSAWKRTGQSSDVLRIEAEAVAVDGLLSVSAGIAFAVIYLIKDGPLGFIAPVGDSIVVLCLCVFAVVTFYSNFRQSLGELAGVTASPAIIRKAGAEVRTALAGQDGRVVDFAVLKAGRTLSVVVYLDPKDGIDAAQVDALRTRISQRLNSVLGRCEVLVVITRQGRTVLTPAPADTASSTPV